MTHGIPIATAIETNCGQFMYTSTATFFPQKKRVIEILNYQGHEPMRQWDHFLPALRRFTNTSIFCIWLQAQFTMQSYNQNPLNPTNTYLKKWRCPSSIYSFRSHWHWGNHVSWAISKLGSFDARYRSFSSQLRNPNGLLQPARDSPTAKKQPLSVIICFWDGG